MSNHLAGDSPPSVAGEPFRPIHKWLIIVLTEHEVEIESCEEIERVAQYTQKLVSDPEDKARGGHEY